MKFEKYTSKIELSTKSQVFLAFEALTMYFVIKVLFQTNLFKEGQKMWQNLPIALKFTK